jgi:hypothetical protein
MTLFLYIFILLALAYCFIVSLEKRTEEALAGRGYKENLTCVVDQFYFTAVNVMG